MADMLKPPDGQKPAVQPPEQMERSALRSSLSGLARTADGEAESVRPAPPPSGREALAALAAEAARFAVTQPVAESATTPDGAPTSDKPEITAAVDEIPRTEPPRPRRPSPTQLLTGALQSSVSQPPTNPLRPIGSARTATQHPSIGGDQRPKPDGAPVRLGQAKQPTAAPAPVVEQHTIPLRRRPISDGPASVSTTPPDATTEVESAGKPAPPAPRVQVSLPAWLPSDDDILPSRTARRGRTFRRVR